jgi:hyperosmotically inducible periplasmic protein
MNHNRLAAFVIASAVLSVLVAGCETTTNTNTNANGNTAVVTNTNTTTNANTAAVNANTRANANRLINANITREEYERGKESFMEEAKRLGRKIGTGTEDGWLWTKTRGALATADDLRDSTINVDVENSVVTLTGTVASPGQKAKAEQVAKGIDGVKSVRNQLTVSATGGNTNQNTNRNANMK